jgi:acetoin utilization deacetylase AcuC-like enzyme
MSQYNSAAMKIFYSSNHQRHDPPFEGYDDSGPLPAYEKASRAESVYAALQEIDWAEFHPPADFGLEPIQAVHSPAYLEYLRSAYDDWKAHSPVDGMAFIPATYGIDHQQARALTGFEQAGFFLMDNVVAIVPDTFSAALDSAHCALTGAQALTTGETTAFSLNRPPGHHAGQEICGGFCYFNNAAIAAQWLSDRGKVAVLDVDYHAGNGTQAIFYERADVLTVSLHADPDKEYPYYAGHATETGAGAGSGHHRNFPLPAGTNLSLYLGALEPALELIARSAPEYLVVSAGMDIFKDDPLGSFKLTQDDIHRIGREISNLALPTLIVMEGGYHLPTLGANFRAFIEPFAKR